MLLKYLELANFRNLARQELEPGAFINLLTGPNAQGKTNLLEAIYLTCTGRSFRTSREKEIITREKEFALVKGTFNTGMREFEVKVILNPGQKRAEVNGSLKRGYPMGWPGVVLFTPDDLFMVKGSPQERRRFLDNDIGSLHVRYRHYLGLYNRVLFQRNNLLREIKIKNTGVADLEVWDEQFCKYGAEILFLRLCLLRKMGSKITGLYRKLAGDKENLELRYQSSVKIDNIDKEEIHSRLVSDIRALQAEEVQRAQTMTGPHRDDLCFLIGGEDARVYGSQGQQRTVVLALKLALIQQWHEQLDEYPLLLLDDVLFELDSNRQKALVDYVDGSVQTFITMTETKVSAPGFPVNKKWYTINNGIVKTALEGN